MDGSHDHTELRSVVGNMGSIMLARLHGQSHACEGFRDSSALHLPLMCRAGLHSSYESLVPWLKRQRLQAVREDVTVVYLMNIRNQ